MARIKDLENKLSIMKDAKGKASTDSHDKFKPIDIKDTERPDKKDKQVAKCNSLFGKFQGLTGELQRELGEVLWFDREPWEGHDQEPEGVHEANKSETLTQHLQSYLRTYTDGEPRA